jgi:hypothetical protein
VIQFSYFCNKKNHFSDPDVMGFGMGPLAAAVEARRR